MARVRFVSYINLGADDRARPDALDTQRAAVAAHLAGCGGSLVAEVQETDADAAWTGLRTAAALCRQHGAILLVAQLGRLAGDRTFLTALRREREGRDLRFRAADMPEANADTLGILAALTALEAPAGDALESEARRARKRDFLAALDARLRPRRSRAGARPEPAPLRGGPAPDDPPCRPRTLERARDVAPVLAEIRAAGATTFEQIAHALNELGVPSARGDRWYPSQVRRVERRIASAG